MHNIVGSTRALDVVFCKKSNRHFTFVCQSIFVNFNFSCSYCSHFGTTDLRRGCMVNVVAQPQINPIVLDIPISLALWNYGAQSVDFGSANSRKLGVFAPQFLGSKYERFRNIPHRVAKFRENRFRDVEKSVSRKKEVTRLKYTVIH